MVLPDTVPVVVAPPLTAVTVYVKPAVDWSPLERSLSTKVIAMLPLSL